MSNKYGRQMYKQGKTLKKSDKSRYYGNGTSSFMSSDYGNMRGYGLACLNGTNRVDGCKPYVNLYSARLHHGQLVLKRKAR